MHAASTVVRSRRLRNLLAAFVVGVLGGAFALAGASTASAATVGHWGTFTVSGATRAYAGSMSLAGFPATTFTSTSRQAQVISGTSVWQGASTPPGTVYGSSRGNTYLNQRPAADNQNAGSAAQTVYTFDTPTPVGGWSFVLGDIDADQATISAIGVDGAAVPISALGYDASYNSCSSVSPGGWSCGAATADDPTPGSDRPIWNAATGTLVGNATASDTAGASAWFSPTVALRSLTISYQQRSGFPVYQTWFADSTAAITGSVTLDGTVLPGTPVTATDSSGTVFRTTTAADGTYAFPALVRTSGSYVVAVDAPPGATGSSTTPVAIAAGDGSASFAFTRPSPTTTSIIGTVTTDVAGRSVPAADVPVTVTTPSGTTTTTTNEAGLYAVSALPVTSTATIAVPGATTAVPTGDGTAPVTVAPLRSLPTVGVVDGTARLDGAALAGATVTLTAPDGTVVATTVTAADGSYAFPTVEADAAPYTVSIEAPVDATGAVSATTVVVAGQDSTVPFVFTSIPEVVTASFTGTLTDASGVPSGGTDVTATSDPADAVTTATAADGTFELDGLQPLTTYTLTAGGATLATVTTPASGALSVGTVVLPAAGTGTGTGGGSGTGGGTAPGTGGGSTTGGTTATAGGSPVPSPGDGVLAFTGSNPTPAIIGAAILVLIGVVFLLARAVRGRRDHHLEDE